MGDRRGARLRKPSLGPDFVTSAIRKSNELRPRRRVARVVLPELDSVALDAEAVVEGMAETVSDKQRARGGWAETSVRATWTLEEDRVLAETVALHGPCKWRLVADALPRRTNKQCRDRYLYHIDPSVLRAPFSPAEDLAIQMGVYELGHKWARIAERLPGRTDNAVKNRYNYFLPSTRRNAAKCKALLPPSEGPGIDDATLMVELQRRNLMTEVPRRVGNYVPDASEKKWPRWSSEEEMRLTLAVRDEKERRRVAEGGSTELYHNSWVNVSNAVGTRTPMSCRAHWSHYASGASLDEIDVSLTNTDGEVESFTFDDVLKAVTMDTDEMKLLCLEPYDEGADEVLAPKELVVQVLGKRSVSLSFRFPPLPPPQKYKGKQDNPPPRVLFPQNVPQPQQTQETQETTTAPKTSSPTSLKEYYPETKRRDEAEALDKSVLS